MRELKFRAWLMDHMENDIVIMGEWAAKNKFGALLNEGIADFIAHDDEARMVLMQYIGRKDKNNVEIYESDIIKSNEYGILVVKWNVDWLCWDFYPINSWDVDEEDTEVIGNIYDNPNFKLLEKI